MEPDCEIVAKVLGGDTEAYAELVCRYERSARAAALAVVGEVHMADDVAQEAFVVAYEKLGRLRAGKCYGPWLLRIVRRQAIRVSRKRRPTVSLETVPAGVIAASCGAASEGAPVEDHQRLLAAVDRLPAHERTAVMLRYFDGLETRAVATAMGCEEGAIFKRLSRARQRLRQWLTEEED